MTEPTNVTPKNKLKLSIALDFKWVSLLLLVAMIAMLAIWRPWSSTVVDENRIVSVTGEAVVKATPDEYVFYPSYEFKDADKQTAINAADAKSTEVVAKLKELGVADNAIKTGFSGYQNWWYAEDENAYYYSLTITITLDNLELAQTVQDYLITTGPQGSIYPTSNFSDSKQNELENQARDEATQDARSKAQRMADNLGFKLGKVKAVTDGSGFGGIEPLYYATDSTRANEVGISSSGVKSSSSIQPGENELNYSITVIYYLK